MKNRSIIFFSFAGLVLGSPFVWLHAETPPGFKPPPTLPPTEASVIVEDQQFIDECAPENMCVEGNLYNEGRRTAFRLKLRVDVGGGKHAKPRTAFFVPLERNTLDAGDRQGFSAVIKRKVSYRDNTGEEKTIEAGKYNVKLVPTWARENTITGSKRARSK